MGAIVYLGLILVVFLLAAVVYGVILTGDLKALAERIQKN